MRTLRFGDWAHLLLFAYLAPGCVPALKPAVISQETNVAISSWEFVAADSAAWPGGDFAEAAWSPVVVPSGLVSLTSSHLKRDNQGRSRGWYRGSFLSPAASELRASDGPVRAATYGIYLGRVQDVDRTYINGVKIGGTGVFGRWPIRSKPRYYAIPNQLLSTPGLANQVAIQIEAWSPSGGLVGSQPIVAPLAEVVDMGRRLELRTITFDTALVTIHVMSIALWVMLLFAGLNDRTHLWLGAVLGSFLLVQILDGLPIYLAFAPAFLDDPSSQPAILFFTLGLVGQAVAVIAAIRYFYRLAGVPHSPMLMGLDAVIVVSLTAGVLVEGGRMSWLTSFGLWGALAATSILIVRYGSRGMRRGETRIAIMLPAALLAVVSGTVASLPTAYPQVTSDLFRASLALLPILMLLAHAQHYRMVLRRADHLGSQLIAATELERGRVARDLHDGVIQRLAAHSLSLKHAQRSGDADLVSRVIDQMGGTADEVRSIVHDLRPMLLGRYGLAEALRADAERLTDRSGTMVTVVDRRPSTGRERSSAAPERCDEHLYRIVQEACSNAVRHGRADRVEVALESDRILVVDNGVGFDPAETSGRERKGLGLLIMVERARSIGGQLVIESSPGHGATVMVAGINDGGPTSRPDSKEER